MKINSAVIISARQSRAWSQQHLAVVCGVSLRTIQRVENNGSGSLETIKSIAAGLELTVSELSAGEQPVTVPASGSTATGNGGQPGIDLAKPRKRLTPALLLSGILSLAGGAFFLAPATLASDISIRAGEVSMSPTGDYQIFRDGVEIFIPEEVAVAVSANGQNNSPAGSVSIRYAQSTIIAGEVSIVKTDDGLLISTGYAEKH